MKEKNVIFLNIKKKNTYKSSIIEFAKNTDNNLFKELNKIDSLTKNILREMAKNNKVTNILMLNIDRKKLKFLHHENRKILYVNKLKKYLKKVK
ncbi:MAG: hypothetical protein LBT02_00965 [Rickettsiales bacterium]|jgi:hypothetical protein|nr:hypothetical protein [Rickettsiales bacterium]